MPCAGLAPEDALLEVKSLGNPKSNAVLLQPKPFIWRVAELVGFLAETSSLNITWDN
jgi:hypothetical protein